MSRKRSPDGRARMRDGLRQFASRERDVADETCAKWGVDDPLHPSMPFGAEQPFRDWVDFVDKVARPLVEANGDEGAVQAAMRLYRQASPYFICVSLLMAYNRALPGEEG